MLILILDFAEPGHTGRAPNLHFLADAVPVAAILGDALNHVSFLHLGK
jgi:hypothetical protein